MFTVYVSDFVSDEMKSFERGDMDSTLELCIDLYQKGYRIRKLVLPSGAAMYQEQVEGAIKSGLNRRGDAVGE